MPPACRGFGDTRFEALPSAAAEVEDVIEIWEASEPVGETDSPEPATRLTGSRASETVVKQEIAGHRVVHLATHGFVLDDGCRETDLGELGTTRAVPESPLRMSGLVFAGANHREAASADEDDGILTAEEISTLDLSAAEWVVLSACDTGLGAYWSTEGILGLRRAFRAAGSGTLLMSLWPVSDRVTRRWVRELYRARFEEERPTDEAVWEANRRLLDRARRAGGDTHPARWAALVGVGG
jgi:CHAT domain-containing protein